MQKTSNHLLASSIALLLLLFTASWGWCATPVPYAPGKSLGSDVSTEVKTGSSVHYPSGTYNFTETDLSLYARGIPMSWGRIYRSNRVINKNGWMFDLPADGPLGYGWMNGWLVRIEGDAYVNGEGKYIYFTKDANGNYLTNQDAGLTLTKTATGFQLLEIGKYIYTFNTVGKLQIVKDLRGNSATLNYDANGNLLSITDSIGRTAFTLNYNSAGRIATVTDIAGRTVTYNYDELGNLTKANLGTETLSTYTYNSNHGLTSKANGLGETYSIDYYPVWADKGIVQKVLDPIGTQLRKDGKTTTGHETSFSYDFTNHVFFVTDYTGALFKHQVNTKGQLLSTDEIQGSDTIPVKRIEYQDNRIVKKTDSLGNSTLEQCDEWGNLIKLVDATGEEKKQTFNTQNKLQTETDALGIITKYDYDTTGYLTKTTWAVGKPEENSTSNTYNSYGELLSTTTGNATYTYAYNNLGRAITITDPEGNIGTNEYDIIGNLTAYIDGVGNRSEYTYDAKDNLISWKDPLGNISTYTYNAARRLTSTKDALGRITQYETDFKGYTTAIIDPLNNRTEYSYDGNGNLIKSTRGDSVITITYDSANRITSVTDPEGNTTTYVNAKPGCASCSIAASTPDQVIDPLLNTTTFTFDKNRRITGITDPMNNVTNLVRNAIGSVAAKKDANNNTTTYTYDALKRTIKQTDAAGGTIQFSYDYKGNLTSLTDPNGNTSTFAYDKNNRVTKETRPMGQSTEYSYYPNGMLKTTKDANGNITTLSYDKASRLTEITYADGTKDSFQYNQIGMLTSYASPGVIGTINYDELSRKTSETVNYGTFSKTYSYTYDTKGNKQSYTSPEGTQYSYGYDKNNQLKTITYNSQTISFDYQWNRLTKATYPNGTTTTYQYNANNWLTDRTAEQNTTTIESGSYRFDKVGNITQKNNNYYGYDLTYQLTNSMNSLHSETFTYDKSGNRTNTGYSHNANNELLSTDTATYTYDNNGNTTTKIENNQTTTYKYNVRNRLSQITLPDGTQISYVYDQFGRRIKKQTPSDTTYYLYANEGLIGEYTEAGTNKKAYGWRPNGNWGANPLFQVDNNSYYYYHNDHLGTPHKITDSAGATVWNASYDAFGNAQIDQASTIISNLRFSGQYYDEETGLHYNWNRFYDPETGRYVQKDPIGMIGGLNLFAYVQNNPINWIDPFGLKKCDPWWGETDKNFKDYVHMRKQEDKIRGNLSEEQKNQYKQDWIDEGKPRGKGGKSGKGGQYRDGGMGGGACFVEHTEVLTINGMRPIESIKVGELVLSRNELTGINEYKYVLELFQLENSELVRLTFGNSHIQVTPIHRFYVEGKGWVNAGDLKEGNMLISSDGKRISIAKIERDKFDIPVRVFNFAVEDNHNYYVSTDTILVHNLKSGGDIFGNPGSHQCFDERTYIQTNVGHKQIKDITIGDMVKTINPETCQTELQRVTRKYGSATDNYYIFTIGNQQREQIRCTETHKFLVVGSGWVEAKSLKEGDIIKSANGNMSIEQIHYVTGHKSINVFNIEVDKNFNYQVSESGVLVVDRWNSPVINCK